MSAPPSQFEPPFIVGKPAQGPYFVDREVVLEKLLTITKGVATGSASNIVLVGLRRTGKTSILHNLALQYQGEKAVVPVIIDCYGVPTAGRFARMIVDRALSAYAQKTGDSAYRKRLLRLVSEKARGAFGHVSEVGLKELSVKFRDPKMDEDILVEDALDYVEKLAEEKRVFFLVLLDEFQDIIEFGDILLKRMRTAIQAQKRTCYVLSGSATTVMRDLVYRKRSPFYRQLVEVTVGKLERSVVVKFLRDRFASVQVKVAEDVLEKVATYCDGFPEYVQRLGLELFVDVGRGGTVTADRVLRAYDEMLLQLDGEFSNYYKTFSPLEAEILVAIASGKNGTAEIAKEARKPVVNISKTLGRLINYGVLERPQTGLYRMADPVFMDWLEGRYKTEVEG